MCIIWSHIQTFLHTAQLYVAFEVTYKVSHTAQTVFFIWTHTGGLAPCTNCFHLNSCWKLFTHCTNCVHQTASYLGCFRFGSQEQFFDFLWCWSPFLESSIILEKDDQCSMQGLDIHLAPEINMTQLSGASKIGYPLIKRLYAKDGLPPQ